MQLISHFNKLVVFNQVVESLSFTLAASKLDISCSMVSQHINHLEKVIGVKLFNRTTRRISLTAEGKELYSVCSQSILEITATISDIQQQQVSPRGKIRITSQTDFAINYLIPLISHFVKQYPLIEIELILGDICLDLIEHNIDLAIRFGDLEDSALVATRIATFTDIICASPDYFRHRDLPQKPHDLTQYNWIIGSMIPNTHQWTLCNKEGENETIRVKGNLKVDSGRALLEFVSQGVGISALPDFMVKQKIQSGELIELIAEYSAGQHNISAVFIKQTTLPYRLRLLINYIKDGMKDIDSDF
jgi:DNA-binding transcriptional LysR family regulator